MDEVPAVVLPAVVLDDCGAMEELWPVEDSSAMDWLGTAPYWP